MLGISYSS
ncbi:hypothetical protein LINGRAHAP2_LOCUS22879 [Linum grandiflorum]